MADLFRRISRAWDGLTPGAKLAVGAAVAGTVVVASGVGAGVASGTINVSGPSGPFGFPPNPRPWPLRRGFGHTIFAGSAVADRWREQREFVRQVQPQLVVVHVWDGVGADPIVAMARDAAAIVPGVQVVVQVAANDNSHPFPPPGVISTADRVRRAAPDLFAAASWDAERGYKGATTAIKRQNSLTAEQLVAGWKRAVAPSHSPQLLTSYPQPASQPSFPCAAFHGGSDETGSYVASVDGEIFQAYPFNDARRSTIAAGEMQRWMRRFGADWSRAVARGWIHADLPLGVDLPSAWVPRADLVDVATKFPFATFWPWHGGVAGTGGYDADAVAAARELSAHFRGAP